MPGSFELHRFTALLGIGFGLVHALVLLGDQYMNYTVGQLLVPFMGGNYRPALTRMTATPHRGGGVVVLTGS